MKNKARSKLDEKLYGETTLTQEQVSRIVWREALAARVATTLNVKKEEI